MSVRILGVRPMMKPLVHFGQGVSVLSGTLESEYQKNEKKILKSMRQKIKLCRVPTYIVRP